MSITSIDDWRPARMFPETYPGDRPSRSYLIIDNIVSLMEWKDPEDINSAIYTRMDGTQEKVNGLLKRRGLPVLEDRYAVLGYGANRNPGTLKTKMHHYKYTSPGAGLVIPILRGSLLNADVVACSISGQGYLYADLLVHKKLVAETSVEVWVNLLDVDQLRVMNDSEGLKQDVYKLAVYQDLNIDELNIKLKVLGYKSNSNIFNSPIYKSPIAFDMVDAVKRKLPALDTISIMKHLIDCFRLEKKIRGLTGISAKEAVAESMIKYLNGQWWYQFNTGHQPLHSYTQIIELIKKNIDTHSINMNSADCLSKSDHIIPNDFFYNPGESFIFRNSILNV